MRLGLVFSLQQHSNGFNLAELSKGTHCLRLPMTFCKETPWNATPSALPLQRAGFHHGLWHKMFVICGNSCTDWVVSHVANIAIRLSAPLTPMRCYLLCCTALTGNECLEREEKYFTSVTCAITSSRKQRRILDTSWSYIVGYWCRTEQPALGWIYGNV